MTSSAIDKKLKNFELIFEFRIAINFEFIFEFFLSISSFLLLADEVNKRQLELFDVHVNFMHATVVICWKKCLQETLTLQGKKIILPLFCWEPGGDHEFSLPPLFNCIALLVNFFFNWSRFFRQTARLASFEAESPLTAPFFSESRFWRRGVLLQAATHEKKQKHKVRSTFLASLLHTTFLEKSSWWSQKLILGSWSLILNNVVVDPFYQ